MIRFTLETVAPQFVAVIASSAFQHMACATIVDAQASYV
jgi:hypothetical protein